MQEKQNNIKVIDAETLMDKRLPPTKFCVDTLLPQGLCILGGAPKVGKAWFVLDLCIHVARGDEFLGLPATRRKVLYLCLEDSERRIQERLNTITADVPEGLYFALGDITMETGICDFLRKRKQEIPELSLIAIDTFQLIRNPTNDVSYGNDYAELRVLKALAEELGICLLLVHHLRKMGDSDPVNRLSGSSEISGAVDAVYILDKPMRSGNRATLIASGRDIRDRKIELEMNPQSCIWTLISDTLTQPQRNLPDELAALYDFLKESKEREMVCTNSELASTLSAFMEKEVNPKGLKQMMNKYRYELESFGVFFENGKSNGHKYVVVKYDEACDSYLQKKEETYSPTSSHSFRPRKEKRCSKNVKRNRRKRIIEGRNLCKIFLG